MESGSLNLPEPSGPHRPLMGMLYLFYLYVIARSACISVVYHFSLYLSIYFNKSSPHPPISSQKDILPFGAEV
jgi:hypothetical protein